MKKIEALFISDVHLGSKGSNTKELLGVLKEYEPEHLFIVGDFIDGWLLKKRHFWTQDFTNLIRKILSYSKRGTKVTYVTGNHDDFLRSYVPMDFSSTISIVDETEFNGYLVTHGDLYDGIVSMKWLATLGSIGYELAISIDRTLKRFGYKKSISKWAKDSVKDAVKFITNFEEQLADQARRRSLSGVICGHIHKPENKIISGIHYLNCGDWIENNSYIIYHESKYEIRRFIDQNSLV